MDNFKPDELQNVSIPQGWRLESIFSFGEIISGNAFKSSHFVEVGIPVVKISNVQSGYYIKKNQEYLPESYLSENKKFIIGKGDLLVALTRPITNNELKICQYPFNYVGLLNQRVAKINIDRALSQKYIHFFLLSRNFRLQVQNKLSETLQPNLSPKELAKLSIPLPPLPEQKVIADKLDSLLAHVETTKARLDRVPDILKRFRQSVLAAAVSGRLTEEWRGNNDTSNIKSLVDQHIAGKKGLLKVRGKSAWDSDLELNELPENWEWIENHKLSQDTQSAICAGPFGTIFKSKDFRETGVPIVFLRHVKEGGFNQNKPKYMDKKVWDEFHQPYSIYGGELLITKLGEPPGECCVYPEDQGVAMVTPDVLKMDTDEVLVDKDYLKHFFNSPISKKMVGDAAFGATRLRIDITLFKKFPIPLPPRNEQTEIVRRVEELFAFADAVEQKAQAASERVNKLTQSILAKAFRGELTADWRAANPDLISGENSAEALLEKIKAEREAMKPKKKTRAKRVKG